MNFYIMTLFPDMVMQGLNTSIIGRAAEKGDRKSTRLNSSHTDSSRMPSSA